MSSCWGRLGEIEGTCVGQSWGGGGEGLIKPSAALPGAGVLSLHPKGVFWEALEQARYPCAPCSPGGAPC